MKAFTLTVLYVLNVAEAQQSIQERLQQFNETGQQELKAFEPQQEALSLQELMQQLQQQEWVPEEAEHVEEPRIMKGSKKGSKNGDAKSLCKPGHEGHSHCTDTIPDGGDNAPAELSFCKAGHEGHSHCQDAPEGGDEGGDFNDFNPFGPDYFPLSEDDREYVPSGEIITIPEIEETKSARSGKKSRGGVKSLCKPGHEGHSHCRDAEDDEIIPTGELDIDDTGVNTCTPSHEGHSHCDGTKAKSEGKSKDCNGSHAGHSHCEDADPDVPVVDPEDPIIVPEEDEDIDVPIVDVDPVEDEEEEEEIEEEEEEEEEEEIDLDALCAETVEAYQSILFDGNKQVEGGNSQITSLATSWAEIFNMQYFPDPRTATLTVAQVRAEASARIAAQKAAGTWVPMAIPVIPQVENIPTECTDRAETWYQQVMVVQEALGTNIEMVTLLMSNENLLHITCEGDAKTNWPDHCQQ